MAENNRNWDNQSQQSDQNWDQDRTRYNQENKNRNMGHNQDYDDNPNRRGSYRNTGTQYSSGDQGSYNHTYYIPDNDENRDDRDRDYENTQYGTSGTYGYRGEYGNDYNPGGYYKGEDRGSFGQNMGNRDEGRNREDWRRSNMGSGYYGTNEGQRNYYRRFDDQNRYNENRYGNTSGMSGEDYRRNEDQYRNEYDSRLRNRSRDYNEGYKSSYEDRDSRGERNWQNRTEERLAGGHKGKGPRDYNRSEERIREDVCDRLSDDDYLDATDIVVQVQGNEVILSGMVENREQKRRAEDLVESISGVRNVENRIRVGHYTEHDYTGTTDKVGGIGNESGTTNEVIRNAKNDQERDRNTKSSRNEKK